MTKGMLLQKCIVIQPDGVRRHLPQLTLRQGLLHGSGYVFRRKIPICNLHRQGRCFQKLVVSQIGLDQAALDAAFKDAGKHQALCNRQIPCQHPDPLYFCHICVNVGHRKGKGDQGQAEVDPAVGQAAFDENQNHGTSRTNQLPYKPQIIPCSIAVIQIAHHTIGKCKDPLVQIVCQYQKE